MSAAHTPTPLRISHHSGMTEILDARGLIYATSRDGDHAAHIVRCVNNHDALVAALRDMLDSRVDPDKARGRAQRALAAVETS